MSPAEYSRVPVMPASSEPWGHRPQPTAVPSLLRSSSKENTAFPAGGMRGSFWQDLGLGKWGEAPVRRCRVGI